MGKMSRMMIYILVAVFIFSSSVLWENSLAKAAEAERPLDDPNEIAEDSKPGVFEVDDFESPEDYQNYLGKHPSPRAQSRATAKKSVSASATLRYKVQGLPSNRVIQKCYIATSYIYVIQKSDKNVNDTILSRCTINTSNKTAVFKDKMILTNFGHGQALEWFEHNSKPYFWIACKADQTYDTKWAIQIGRLQYEPNTTKDYTQICRFSSMSYANKKGTSIGEVKRVDAALSSDKSKVLFWVMDKTGEIQYSTYKASSLNSLLDKKESQTSKYIPCTDSAVKSACLGSIRQSGSARVLPHGSCQGVELSDTSTIYVAGGPKGQSPQIAKMIGSGSSYTYSYLATTKTTSKECPFNSETEMEGIQLKGDDIYFGICNHSVDKKKEQYIFSIKKSVFK